MYKSKLLNYPDHDLKWFHDEVTKFNAIGNPDGVDLVKQLPIAISELQEILDSTNEKDFMDGIIDGLVTLAPFVKREDFEVYVDDRYEEKLQYTYLKEHIKDFIFDTEIDFDYVEVFASSLVQQLLCVLVSDLMNYERNVESICESNLSKFIPKNVYKVEYLDEVKAKYPNDEVNVVEREYQNQIYMVFLNAKTGKILKGHSYFKEPVLRTIEDN